MDTNITPYKFPCKNVSHDGYPNLTQEEINQLPTRTENWFLKNVHKSIFVCSASINGLFEVTYEQAKQLYKSQKQGFKFITLIERSKHALGAIHDDQSKGFQEPQLDTVYTFDFFINGVKTESKQAKFAKYTENLRFYVFEYQDGPDNDGAEKHLLPIGNFPVMVKRLSGEVITCEIYSLTNSTVSHGE